MISKTKMHTLPVVSAGETVEHRLLPLAKLPIQIFCDIRLSFDDVVFLSLVVAQVEQFSCRLATGLAVDDEFVTVAQNDPGTVKVVLGDFGMMEVAEVARCNGHPSF